MHTKRREPILSHFSTVVWLAVFWLALSVLLSSGR